MENTDELEIKELFQTLRTFFTFLVQAFSAMAIANITVIGYAIANQVAGILFLGAIIDVFTLIVFVLADSLVMSSLYYRLVAIRKKLGSKSLEFIPIFLSNFYYASLSNDLENLSKIKDTNERNQKLRKLFIPSGRKLFRRVALFFLAAFLQLAMIPILVELFNWKLF